MEICSGGGSGVRTQRPVDRGGSKHRQATPAETHSSREMESEKAPFLEPGKQEPQWSDRDTNPPTKLSPKIYPVCEKHRDGGDGAETKELAKQ